MHCNKYVFTHKHTNSRMCVRTHTQILCVSRAHLQESILSLTRSQHMLSRPWCHGHTTQTHHTYTITHTLTTHVKSLSATHTLHKHSKHLILHTRAQHALTPVVPRRNYTNTPNIYFFTKVYVLSVCVILTTRMHHTRQILVQREVVLQT